MAKKFWMIWEPSSGGPWDGKREEQNVMPAEVMHDDWIGRYVLREVTEDVLSEEKSCYYDYVGA